MEPKRISKEAVPDALKKVERYRELNQPVEAESICHDILAVDPDNQEARALLVLTLTDQFAEDMKVYREAVGAIEGLSTEYARLYYTGIVYERRARAHFQRGTPGSPHVAYEWFQRALESFEAAEKIRPGGNDDVLFRWNSIVRTLERHPGIQPTHQYSDPQLLE